MKKTPRIACIFVVLVVSASARALDAARVFSDREYAVELERLSSLADFIHEHPDTADQAISELRGNWKVQADGHDFFVDTGWLIDRFRTPDPPIGKPEMVVNCPR